MASILIVDDELDIRDLLEGEFSGLGHDIETAGSVKDALLLGGAKNFDVVFLDIRMPDGNGLDLMHDMPLTTQVIALTAEVNREIELQCHNAGCDAVLEKNRELLSLRELVKGRSNGSTTSSIRSPAPSGSYITFLAEILGELDDAQRKSDFLVIRRIAHRLRGTAIHFGYPGIGSAAKTVSSALRAGRLEQFDTATSSLRARISDALEAHHLQTRKTAITEAPLCEFS